MKFEETKIKGLYIVEPDLLEDERGYFTRIFSTDVFEPPVQINQSLTKKKGTIRGLHYQKTPYEEDKLMQCIQGSIFNVAVDIDKSSRTYLQWVGVELSPENHKMLLVPKGCANGFQTLEDNSIVQYLVSTEYVPQAERGIRWDDPKVGIKWPLKKVFISIKDEDWPLL